MKLPAKLQSAVSQFEKQERIYMPLGHGKRHCFDVWMVTGLSDWPDPVAEPSRIATGKQTRQLH